jgi:hypothetical protein
LTLKTPWSDGTEIIALTYFELIERLCVLVPRPGTHRVRYHGVLACASPHRAAIVPTPPESADDAESGTEEAEDATEEAEDATEPDPQTDGPSQLVANRRQLRRLLWAEFLKRTFGADPAPLRFASVAALPRLRRSA